MRELTPDQRTKVQQISNATALHRHRLTTINPVDRDSRLFQMEADFHSMEVVIHHAAGKDIPKESAEFLKNSLKGKDTQVENEINAFIQAVEQASGRRLPL